jgi:hypothetical protein
MTDRITPEGVEALIEEHRWDKHGRFSEVTSLEAIALDLATAYLAQAEEIERLRKRVDAADRLARAFETMSWGNWIWQTDMPNALAAYHATEDET